MYKPSKKPVQFAKHLKDVPKSKLRNEYLVSEKFDGVFGYAVLKKGDYRVFSRTGEHYTSLDWLKDELEKFDTSLDTGFKYVLVFEVYEEGKPLEYINGRCRRKSDKIRKGVVETEHQYREAVIKVHDILEYDGFVNGLEKSDYDIRYNFLKSFKYTDTMHLVQQSTFVFEDDNVLNDPDLNYAHDTVVKRGGEGLILRTLDGMFKAGARNEDVIKFVKTISLDVVVTKVNLDGKGKYEGLLGTLEFCMPRYGVQGNDWVTCKCSGMSDKLRKEWTANPELIVGKTITVEAKRYTLYGALREPRYKTVRHDTEPDFTK